MIDLAFDRALRSDVDFWNSVQHDVNGGTGSTDWQTVFGAFQATLDYPGCFFWRELMAAYPRAKVILTTHPRGAEAWYESTRETIYADVSTAGASQFGRAIVEMMDRHVWGPDGFFQGRFEDRDFAIARYQAHSAAVRAGVPADRLIEYSVTQGWGPICAALDLPVPDQPFPRINERGEKALQVRRLERMRRFGLGRRDATDAAATPVRQPDPPERST